MASIEQTLIDLAERTKSPYYAADQFLMAAALPENQAPPIQVLTGETARIQRIFDEGEARDAGRGDNKVTGTSSAPKLQASSVIQQDQKGATDLLSRLDARLKEAMSGIETNPTAAIQNLAAVNGEIAAEDARFKKEAQVTAYSEFGVTRFAEELARNEALDRADPRWAKEQSDSKQTASVRSMLIQAKTAADGSIPERLAGNTTYRTLLSKAQAIGALIESTTRRNLSKEEDLDRKASEFYYSMPPEQKTVFDKAIGNTEGDPRMAMATVARFSRIPGQMQQLEAVLQGGEKAIPSLALSGNIFAKKIALDAEAKIFGDKDVAAKKLQEVEKISIDTQAAVEAWKQLKMDKGFSARVGAEKIKAQDQAVSMMIAKAGSGNKQAQQEYASLRSSIAEDFAHIKAQRDFDSDLLSLRNNKGIQAPVWLTEAGKDPAVGKIDKTKAIALVGQGKNIEEKRQRMKELVDFYGAAAERQQGSMFFRVNPLATESLKVEATLGLFGDLSKWAQEEHAADVRRTEEGIQKFKDTPEAIRRFFMGDK